MSGASSLRALSMSAGKTLQSISLLATLTLEQRCANPHLVVVPLSVLGNWMREIVFWCPKLKALKLHGNKEERAEQVATMREGRFNICVTTFETVGQEISALKKIAFEMLVIDEVSSGQRAGSAAGSAHTLTASMPHSTLSSPFPQAHRLKNESSKLATLLRQLSSSRRLLLTGTPIQNNLHELWALLNFLYPEVFTSSEIFDASFDSKSGTVGSGLVNQLHTLLQRCLLRRLKSDVEKGLPPKTETKIFLPLSPMQTEWYRKVLMRDLRALGDARGQASTSVQNIVMHLRKVCNHPYLFDGAEPGPPFVEGEHLVGNSGKLAVLDKLLKRLKEGGHRVLIFSTMTRMLDILQDYCDYRRYDFCRLDGTTSTTEREEMMAEFNAKGSSKFIFMLSTRAGGLGINLFTADTVILYDSDWNPQADLQAQDRAHRIGQTRPVHVYRFVSEGTLEEKILERAERKLYLDRLVIEQGRLTMQMPSLKPDELLGLIRFGADNILKSKGKALTDEDIDVLMARGKERTEEMKKKLQADCQHSLANFSMENGDPSKLYQLDGVEYDAKGVRDLIDKLQKVERGEGVPPVMVMVVAMSTRRLYTSCSQATGIYYVHYACAMRRPVCRGGYDYGRCREA